MIQASGSMVDRFERRGVQGGHALPSEPLELIYYAAVVGAVSARCTDVRLHEALRSRPDLAMLIASQHQDRGRTHRHSPEGGTHEAPPAPRK